MSLSEKTTTLTLPDARHAEERMRTALGLAPDTTFARRPEPQQTHARNPQGSHQAPHFRNRHAPDPAFEALQARLTAAHEALRAEKDERVAAQQALADAQRTIQQLQTKLAHTEMAAAEALAAEQQARLAAEGRFQEASSAAASMAPQPSSPKKRGRPPGKRQAAEAPEPEPVQWWLPKGMRTKAGSVRGRS